MAQHDTDLDPEELDERYNAFVREHGPVIREYFSLLIDLAEARGVAPAGDPGEVAAAANVMGSEGDHNTRCLAALVLGAARSAVVVA